MSEGNLRCEAIMAPLMFKNLDSEVYNPIYEAVDVLPDRKAQRLVEAIVKLLEKKP